MKKLSITFITLVIFSAVEGLAQERPEHHNNTQSIDQSSAATESIDHHNDSTSLAAIAKLPMNNIHFRNKGARQQVDTRWEDSLMQKDRLIKTTNKPATPTNNLAAKPKPEPSTGFQEMVEDQKNGLHYGPYVNKEFIDGLKNQPSSNYRIND